jgi:membrane-associated phospholipid phosphatase
MGLYVASMAIGIFIGLLWIIGWKELSWRKALDSAIQNAPYVVLIVGMPLIMLAENILRSSEASKEIIYTDWIFSISGNWIRIVQDRLDYQLLTDFFILVYVWVFTYILYFTPLLILARDDRKTLRRYTLAIMFNYVFLLPFYLFFPVSVTGFYPDAGVTPLLYIDTNWGRAVTGVDPLDNDFPSAHVSLVVTTLIVMSAAGLNYRRFCYFIAVATAGIVFAVLYLGVHWVADVMGGFILAFFAVLISSNDRLEAVFSRKLDRISDKALKKAGTSSHSKP